MEPFLLSFAILMVKSAHIRGRYHSGKNRISLEENVWQTTGVLLPALLNF
jgi:hypothetical protein